MNPLLWKLRLPQCQRIILLKLLEQDIGNFRDRQEKRKRKDFYHSGYFLSSRELYCMAYICFCSWNMGLASRILGSQCILNIKGNNAAVDQAKNGI